MEQTPPTLPESQAAAPQKPSKGRAVGAALLYFGVYLIMQLLVAAALMGILAFKLAPSIDPGNMQAFIETLLDAFLQRALLLSDISNLLTLAVLALIFLLRRRNPLREAFLVRAPYKPMLWLVPLGVFANVLLASALSFLPASVLDAYLESAAFLESDGWYAPLLIVFIAPFTEEVVFRGLIYTRLKRAMPRALALLLSSLLFGLMHGQALWIAYAFALGALLCLIFDRCKTLWASVLFHAAFNAGNLLSALVAEQTVLPALLFSALLCAVCAYFFIARTASQENG